MKVYDVVFAKQDENNKTVWQRVGILIEKDKKFRLKLDMVPVGNNWDGWLNIFEKDNKKGDVK